MVEPDAERGFEIRDRRHRAEEEASPEKDPSPERPVPPPAPAQRTLVGLFMMLASLAMAALEGVQDPATGQTVRDPRQAGEVIDTLMLLREKTEGHRTPEESQALDELIYDLQVRYVSGTTTSS